MEINGYGSIPGAARESVQDPAVRPDAQVNPRTGGGALDDATPSESATDTVEISAKARELLAAGQTAQPEQPEMVAYVRQFMQNKLYNDQGLLEDTAKKLAPILTAEA